MRYSTKTNLTIIAIAVMVLLSAASLRAQDGAQGENAKTPELLQEVLIAYMNEYGRIRNPWHVWFNPDEFSFEDYTITQCTKWEVLAKLFPTGTPMEFVDRVLVDAGETRKQAMSMDQRSVFRYTKDLPAGPKVWMDHSWIITVEYDQSNTVVDVLEHDESAYDFYEMCKYKPAYHKEWREDP